MKHRARVWKTEPLFQQRLWRFQCTCMRTSGAVYRYSSWIDAMDAALAHWHYWHRQEA